MFNQSMYEKKGPKSRGHGNGSQENMKMRSGLWIRGDQTGSNWAQNNNLSSAIMLDSQMNLSNSFDFDAEEPIEIGKMENPVFVVSKEVPNLSRERSPSHNSKKLNKIIMRSLNLNRPRPNFRTLVSASGGDEGNQRRGINMSQDSSPAVASYQHISPRRQQQPDEIRFSIYNNTIRKQMSNDASKHFR